ncbi:hypothetical protein J6590_094784 [Homalodisca vitripennis]|nr:hypothetical protein J6590_094784 [Homalodisca vitripennis]
MLPLTEVAAQRGTAETLLPPQVFHGVYSVSIGRRAGGITDNRRGAENEGYHTRLHIYDYRESYRTWGHNILDGCWLGQQERDPMGIRSCHMMSDDVLTIGVYQTVSAFREHSPDLRHPL